MFIRRSKIKKHIAAALKREKEMSSRHAQQLLDSKDQHYQALIERQRDEYEAIIESCDRQISALKMELADGKNLFEHIKFGAKSNSRIASDLVHWAERFMKTGADAYQEIHVILDDATAGVRRLEK